MKKIINKAISKIDIKEIIKFAGGSLAGFIFFLLTSHPKSPVNKKIPKKRIKNFTFFPSIKVHMKKKHVHLHHWINIGFVYFLLLLLKRNFLKYKVFHGFILGSIIQGLTYKDRFNIIR